MLTDSQAIAARVLGLETCMFLHDCLEFSHLDSKIAKKLIKPLLRFYLNGHKDSQIENICIPSFCISSIFHLICQEETHWKSQLIYWVCSFGLMGGIVSKLV